MEKYGIKETTEVFELLLSSAAAAKEAKENDGKIDIKDGPLLLDPLIKAPTAINGIEQVPAELADLSDEEITQLENQLGSVVRDPDWLRAFSGFANFASAIQNIVEKGKADEAKEALRGIARARLDKKAA